MQTRNIQLWSLWILLTLLAVLFLFLRMTSETGDKTVFLPGHTSAGHYQIELACTACHTESFTTEDVMQDACMNCHGEALDAAKDDHPKSKFTDPRNADRLAVLDARYCATCHVEHRQDITQEMGVTVPADTCYLCHSNIAEDRPSHIGMSFESCTDAGCHNFHDNRALYEDFLLKHAQDTDTLFDKVLVTSNLIEVASQLPDYPLDDHPLEPAELADQNLPSGLEVSDEVISEWLASSHAVAGVGCAGCHDDKKTAGKDWIDKPDHQACSSCHAGEVDGFLSGKHGMRLDRDRIGQQLSPMSPALARLPMTPESQQRELSCQSCHSAHQYDSKSAVVDSCLDCHADEHSLSYQGSPHALLLEKEHTPEGKTGSGVSCASCHMPRVEKDYYWGTFVHNEVQHNQSANLRPNEKMIRPVCLECHGLGFAIDALADPALIRNNFSGQPALHVKSIDLAVQRLSKDTESPETR